MAKKYVVAGGNAFTANGHIYSAGEVIPEAVFADKTYFAKLLSEKKILAVVGDESKEEKSVANTSDDASSSTTSTKKSKKSKAE